MISKIRFALVGQVPDLPPDIFETLFTSIN
jgi:hypothetical protein